MRFKIGDRFIPRLRKINIFAKKADNAPTNVDLQPQLPNGEEHPCPFYESGEITLAAFTDPPWKEEEEQEARDKFSKMMNDPRNGKHFRDAFLKEIVEEQIMIVASSVLAEKKNEKHRDEIAVIVTEEDILVPTVQLEIFRCVWELLFDWGRNLPAEEYQELQKREKKLQMDDEPRNALTSFMMDAKGSSDNLQEQKKLSGYKWDCLLYNYHWKLQQSSFKKNVALHILQEDIVSKAGADEVLGGFLSYLQRDMIHLDEREKVESPPRKG